MAPSGSVWSLSAVIWWVRKYPPYLFVYRKEG
nr:MAG TPA: hypothetical protein [Caudoviricetes sp.]